ncbi:MAG TPA: hypothetical protein VHS31_18805 [Tepidisphaeraceae bacterium]|nr:hypothetical protein [Tepidisphaeraceae bacterium]
MSTRQQLVCALGCASFYGLVMGSSGGFTGERAFQPIYSAIKVPVLIWLTFVLSLPIFFTLNTLLGLRDDFAQCLRALLKTQMVAMMAIASLAPYTAVWYLSTSEYEPSILFNAFMFTIASLAGQSTLRRMYRPMIERNSRHRLMLRLWLFICAFVGIQMGWVLRPFVGDPQSSVHFFRQGAFSNAYIIVARLIWHTVTRASR